MNNLPLMLACAGTLVVFGWTAGPPSAAYGTDASNLKGTCPGDELFSQGAVHVVSISMTPSNLDALRKLPREFVRANVQIGSNHQTPAAVHLKGSVGSFQAVDAKPSLTLDFSRFTADTELNGLRRIHLNNSAEDPSYANEVIGYEVFRAAGLPAPRVAHALVTFNDRRLGLYVLKEGFTEDFLACHFKTFGGDLYEPGEDRDLDGRLKRHSIDAPHRGPEVLNALATVARETDLSRRWLGLQNLLQLDEFLRYVSLEVMIGHRDGYCMARNNYRVYYDFERQKISFFPHGMDQLFGKPDLPWEPSMVGLVAKGLLEVPEGRERYRETFKALFTNVFQLQFLTNRLDCLATNLRPCFHGKDLHVFDEETASLKARIVERYAFLRTQLNQHPAKPIEFTDDVANLAGWVPIDCPIAGSMGQTEEQGTMALHIVAQGETAASWRTKAILPQGHYRFEGKAKAHGVVPLPFGRNQGIGLRVGGGSRQTEGLIGESTWTSLGNEFHVDVPHREVEFICELRAISGEAWFDTHSLRVVRIK